LQAEQQAAEVAQLKGPNVKAEWGQQIRNYVLDPYKLVKDTRTNFETSDVEAVLNGKLDDFIDSYLASQVGQKPA
jgi:peptide chain release factor 2